MKIFIRFLSVLLALQGFAATWLLNPPSAQASEMPDVIINEVMWMGSSYGTSPSDEWLELRNLTSDDIDISGWKLTNASNGADEVLTIPTPSTINASGYFLISRLPASTSAININPDWEANVEAGNRLELDNTCEQIDLTLPDDTIVDSMGCDGGYFYEADPQPKHALERNVSYGDGLMASSWHERTAGSANLDSAVTDLATPKFVNDVTAPETASATVNDGLADDIAWSNDTTSASANWTGFADAESDLTGSYDVSLLDSLNNVIANAVVWDITHTFTTLSLAEDESYHFSVKAINNVGLESSAVESNGFTVNIAVPAPVTNLSVSDVAGDNGGSVDVDWDPSLSLDEITYRVEYHKVGSSTTLSADAGVETELVVNGLENYPTVYEFTVIAVDFSLLESVGNPIATGSPTDNLAPVLNGSKVTVEQNRPGTNDVVSGQAGAVSEMATVTIFDRHPSDPLSSILASVPTNAGLGFDAVAIGDNLHGKVWIQLIDAAGNSSIASPFTNDIVGPKAAVITQAKASCYSHRCNVELTWQGDSSDTDYYQIRYLSGVTTKTSLPIEKNTLMLNLEADGEFNKFVVIGFDQYGNPSAQSNAFLASLVPGVITSATLVNGQLVITTSSVEASRETLREPVEKPQVKLVPSAQAADNDSAATDNGVKLSGNQDWLRITIVVILLLIVAGGFYSLSRSMQKSSLDAPSDKSAKKSPTPQKKKVSKKPPQRRRTKR
jgi:hypothetical protein